MFDIRVLPISESGPDGERLGRISIGDFSERFACHAAAVPVEQFMNVWRDQLQSLLDGRTAIALQHDPSFAWIVYREGEQCYVQQMLAINGNFDSISPRCTLSEGGERISEWPIGLKSIAQFLKRTKINE